LLLALPYVCRGLIALETLSSPNSQSHVWIGQPAGVVDRSLKSFVLPPIADDVNWAVGRVQTEGVGEGVGLGDADGDAEADGDADADGDGDAEPEGDAEALELGLGLGVGVGVGAGAGTVTMRVVVSEPPWFVTVSVTV
jgi:hypothetical protein